MAYTATGVVIDLKTGLPITSRPRVFLYELTGSGTLRTPVSSAIADTYGRVSFASLTDGKLYTAFCPTSDGFTPVPLSVGGLSATTLAAGSNSTVLQTSSGGTVQWATVTDAMLAGSISATKLTAGAVSTILNTSAAGTQNWGKLLPAMVDSSFWAAAAQIANIADTESAGVSDTAARGDHVHDVGNNIITTSHLASSLYVPFTSYTPELAGSTTAGVQGYSASRAGAYIKIGGLCIAWFQIILTSYDAATAGSLYVTLPLTMVNANIIGAGYIYGFHNINLTAGYTQVTATITSNTDRLTLNQGGDNVAGGPIDATAISASVVLRGLAVYPVA